MTASLSLKRKITIGTLAILSVCMVSVGLISLDREGKRLKSDLQAQGEKIASLVAHFCATPIKKYSFYIVQEVARNAEQAEGIAFCEVYDAQGESLVQVETTIHGTKLPKKPRRTGDDILIVEKIIEEDNQKLGRVEIGLELNPIREELQTYFSVIAISTLIVLILVGIAINLFLTRYFISPVVDLSQAVSDLARGDFVETRISKRDDEIGQLARAFNEMSNNLKQLYQNLENKVDERTADLARANRRLKEEINVRHKVESDLITAKESAEQANRYKSNFVANISHEIRTPLNAIIGYTQILQSRGSFNDDDKNGLDSIDRAGSHLLGLINDILDLSKIEAGRMELKPEPLDLCLLLRNMAGMFQLRCSEKSLSWQVVGIDTSDIIPVIADAGKLRQVLINLLGNAVKFTEHGSVVLRVTSDNNSHYRFCIEDTGPGIPKEARETIFTPFSNMSEENNKEGTGLGLSITNSFLKLMGSHLEVLDNTPEGLRFCFDLQLPPTSALSLPKQKPKRRITGIISEKPITALIVDDDELSRTLLVQLLSNVQIETIQAQNGIEALKSIEKTCPDIVLMDRYMPEMGGIETIKKINERYGKDAPPIVMVTAAAIDSKNGEYDKAGAAGLLLKPCDISDILECMVAILGLEAEVADMLPDDPATSTETTISEPTKLHLPAELSSRVAAAAEFGKISELKLLAAELKKIPGVSPLTLAHFNKHLKSYQLDEILKMLDKATFPET